MSASNRTTLICNYRYDPLDRLVGSIPYQQTSIQRFYCRNRLATQIQGGVQCSIFQHAEHLLAQQQHHDAKVDSHLLATDTQRSVLTSVDVEGSRQFAYSPYGHRPSEHDALSPPGFNGEQLDPFTGHYHLGNGYRQFNPVLMRFNSPDSRSPFGEGGLNSYAYCEGDPRNWTDQTGHGRIPAVKPVTKVMGNSQALSTTPEVASGVSGLAKKPRRSDISKAKQREISKRHNARVLEQLKAIKRNEAEHLKNTTFKDLTYNLSDEPKTFESAAAAYEVARKNYEFDIKPDPLVEWRFGHVLGPVDVAHFDATIFYLKKANGLRLSGFSNYVYRKVKLQRAEYLDRFAKTKFTLQSNTPG